MSEMEGVFGAEGIAAGAAEFESGVNDGSGSLDLDSADVVSDPGSGQWQATGLGLGENSEENQQQAEQGFFFS